MGSDDDDDGSREGGWNSGSTLPMSVGRQVGGFVHPVRDCRCMRGGLDERFDRYTHCHQVSPPDHLLDLLLGLCTKGRVVYHRLSLSWGGTLKMSLWNDYSKGAASRRWMTEQEGVGSGGPQRGASTVMCGIGGCGG